MEPGAVRAIWTGRVVIGFITLALLGLLGRVAQLEMHAPPALQQLLDTQHSTALLHARRGMLKDRQGRDVAASGVTWTLFVDPHAIQDPNTFSEKVGHALGYDPAWVEQTIAKRMELAAAHDRECRYVVLDKELSDEQAAKLKDLHLPGIGAQMRLVRDYPQGTLGGQVVGFVGFEGRGLEGAERAFDRDLRGTDGKLTYYRDVRHEPLWIEHDQYRPPADGKSVRLSIDLTIQAIVEEALRKTCQDYGARAGQIVVMQPVTGEILAMANYPLFDPNEAGHSTADDRRDRSITDFFEPGSIFKPFVWSAATQMGIARPEEVIDCTGGLWVTANGRRLHDAHGNGIQTWDGVLIKSSNIGMGKIGERMGQQRMYLSVHAFGFGQLPGSGLQGESPGMLNQLRRWSGYSVTSIPMGQEIGVTPLQITRGYCTFANGGFLVKPTLRACDDPAAPQLSPHFVARVLTPAVAQHTREVLRRVVTEGTGKKAESPYYTIFGKTGTAQIAARGRGGYQAGQYIASFIGGAPVRNPQIVVGCFIHHPDPAKGHFGGIVSAPAVKSVVEQTLLYLGVPPDQDPSKMLAGNIDARE